MQQVQVSNTLNKTEIQSLKKGSNLSLAASAVDEIAVIAFSFTIEHPLSTN